MTDVTKKILPIDSEALRAAAVAAALQEKSTTQVLLGYIDVGVAQDIADLDIPIVLEDK